MQSLYPWDTGYYAMQPHHIRALLAARPPTFKPAPLHATMLGGYNTREKVSARQLALVSSRHWACWESDNAQHNLL